MSGPTTSDFRDVASHFATGVAIVGAATPHGPRGFTCQSFGSLSLDPLLVTFAASHGGETWRRVRDAERVAVSVLGADQTEVARRFSTSGAERFSVTAWHAAPGGSPLVDGAIAYFEGRFSAVTSHGDHDVAVLEVDWIEAPGGEPLIYFRRTFTRLV